MSFPRTVTANDHAILWLRDPTAYPFLREVNPLNTFKYGLPRLDLWDKFGDDLVGIEGPAHPDEYNNLCHRAWVFTTVERCASEAPDCAVYPASVAPGLPSRTYRSTGEG